MLLLVRVGRIDINASIYKYSTVEPIFNDISNSDNCCYNDRFANPRFFLSLSHVIYFYNNEYKNRFYLL